ncbi:hypothetical protein [Verminephrobacter eiseniae]|uniref:hypothetical protein n=1 Tax=Verminephrobacter eiseniae TaxID=364317 RepID=UPI002238FBCC|nr:hypothetical protein [Verminephrobacter eiseniae]
MKSLAPVAKAKSIAGLMEAMRSARQHEMADSWPTGGVPSPSGGRAALIAHCAEDFDRFIFQIPRGRARWAASLPPAPHAAVCMPSQTMKRPQQSDTQYRASVYVSCILSYQTCSKIGFALQSGSASGSAVQATTRTEHRP